MRAYLLPSLSSVPLFALRTCHKITSATWAGILVVDSFELPDHVRHFRMAHLSDSAPQAVIKLLYVLCDRTVLLRARFRLERPAIRRPITRGSVSRRHLFVGHRHDGSAASRSRFPATQTRAMCCGRYGHFEHFAYTRVANEFLAYCAMAHTALMLTVRLTTASFTYLKRHTLWPS